MIDLKEVIQIIDEEEVIIIRKTQDGFGYITVDRFERMFEGAEIYEDFISHPSTSEGWKTKFKEWKDLGYF